MSNLCPIEDILSQYTPEPEFTVTLARGEKLKFRSHKSHEELRDHQKAAANWFAGIPNPLPEGHPWEGLAPTNAEDAYNVFTISELSIAPKITQIHAMRMLKAPGLVEYLSDRIEAGLRTMRSQLLVAAVEASKKNLGVTDTSETNSPSAETPSENTPTN